MEIKYRVYHKDDNIVTYYNKYHLYDPFEDGGIVQPFAHCTDMDDTDLYLGDVYESGDAIGVIEHGEYGVDDVYDCGITTVIGFYGKEQCLRDNGTIYDEERVLEAKSYIKVIGNIEDANIDIPKLLARKLIVTTRARGRIEARPIGKRFSHLYIDETEEV